MDTWIQLFESNDLTGIKQYIKNGADLNASSEHDESVLALALKMHCDEEIIDLLVASGADTDDFDEEGVSIFDYTITYNHPALFQKLIDSGIDVNQTRRKSRFTPLMAAVCYSRLDMAKTLLAKGADTQAQDHKGFKAIDFARKMRKRIMFELLGGEL